MKWATCVATGLAALCLSGGDVSAHAFGARYDLPLPLAIYLWAAGLAVAASFVAAILFVKRSEYRLFEIEIAIPIRLQRFIHPILALLGIALLFVLVITAFVGPAEVTRNFATVFVWVIWWVGFFLVSALVITLWPLVNPFQHLAMLTGRLARNDTAGIIRPLPEHAGYFAPFGIFCLAWIELVSDWSEDPRALGVLICAFAAFTVGMALIFGAAWFREADPLSRMFELLGRLAIIRLTPSNLAIGLPGEGLQGDTRRPAGEVQLVCVLIGVVLFDGLSETPAWVAILDYVSESQSLRGTLLYLRGQGVDLLKMITSFGLLATVVITIAVYYGLAWASCRAARSDIGAAATAAAFAASLLPIAVAYHLSHYTSYLLIAGQLLLPAASDPFALGWDLFGTAGRGIDIGIINARHVWWIAFVALIAGHSLSVLAGHRRALALFGNRRAASRSQIPMAAAMIGLTVLSLWILSQPIVE